MRRSNKYQKFHAQKMLLRRLATMTKPSGRTDALSGFLAALVIRFQAKVKRRAKESVCLRKENRSGKSLNRVKTMSLLLCVRFLHLHFFSFLQEICECTMGGDSGWVVVRGHNSRRCWRMQRAWVLKVNKESKGSVTDETLLERERASRRPAVSRQFLEEIGTHYIENWQQ